MVLPPGGSTTVEVDYVGTVAAGPYELLVRPQPLPNPDEIEINVVDTAGNPIVTRTGPIPRRSVLDDAGISAWR